MMMEIKLVRGVWRLDESQPLGPPGGFGEVFRGSGEHGEVAIKRLKLTASAAAHREMNIGKALANRSLVHVVPVLDYGQDAETDRYYLVMPLCEYSLQDVLKKKTRLPWKEAKAAALDIIAGLREVNDIVHRDLKPGNVLWHEGRWRVADFGIAKFVEDSTSLETLRGSLTPAYAAPEQWLGQAPTRATDVYALGCILHAMINGTPPFTGDLDDVRRGHLHDQPPDLRDVDPRLNGLVQFMLRKNAASRPSFERCANVIEGIAEGTRRPHFQALAVAGNAVAQEEAAAEARRIAKEAARRERAAVATEGIRALNKIMARLFDEIEAASEAVQRAERAITMGPAYLSFEEPELVLEGQLQEAPPYERGWDVLAFSQIRLRASLDRQRYSDPPVYTFSATLVFARTGEDRDLRWRELSFFNWLGRSTMDSDPIALSPKQREFHLALSNVVSGWQLAYGPFAIDAEDEESFRERWINLFAKAAQRRLRPPSNLPLPKSFFS